MMMTFAARLAVSLLLMAGLPSQADPSRTKRGPLPQLFAPSEQCLACHNSLMTPEGKDVSIGSDWRASMMANAARDPYWQAAVRREVMDHPEARAAIEHECAACHMPMSRFQAKAGGGRGEVFSHLPVLQKSGVADRLAADGVSCTVCHQITEQGFGGRGSFTGGFAIDTRTLLGERKIYGPYEVDSGRKAIMRSASEFLPQQASHIQRSELCATCHTLYTRTLGPGGEVVGELPEQVPYLEWRHSAYADRQSCQSCHMPVVEGEMPISSVLGEQRVGFSRHAFRGGNFFMLRMLNRYREELGLTAPSRELERAAHETLQYLQSEAARVSIAEAAVSAGRLEARVVLENLAGHKLPTAYPSRRAWVRFTVRDAQGRLLFESGGFNADGSIQGNDNDAHPALYEPHYERIDRPDQVQIYESILVDPQGAVTTGLLTALRFIKDNRLLPAGFDKATAHRDIAVRGGASVDSDFDSGADRIVYSVNLAGSSRPLAVQAELWYQPIAFRWAHNLRSQRAAETDRFVSYYESMSASSAAILAQDTVTVP